MYLYEVQKNDDFIILYLKADLITGSKSNTCVSVVFTINNKTTEFIDFTLYTFYTSKSLFVVYQPVRST